MATVTTQTNSYISDIEGWCIYADALFGDNGDTEGVPEYDVGTNSDNAYGFITWGNPNNNIDSGNLAINFNAPASGQTITWAIQNASTLSYSGVGHGTIQSVQIVAGVQASGCKFSWGSLVVAFYKSGILIESVSLSGADNPVADGIGSGAPTEQITTITPANNNNDQVVITGTLRLQVNAGVYPGEDDVFGDIFVFTSSCSQ
jgi:hypothetical protein